VTRAPLRDGTEPKLRLLKKSDPAICSGRGTHNQLRRTFLKRAKDYPGEWRKRDFGSPVLKDQEKERQDGKQESGRGRHQGSGHSAYHKQKRLEGGTGSLVRARHRTATEKGSKGGVSETCIGTLGKSTYRKQIDVTLPPEGLGECSIAEEDRRTSLFLRLKVRPYRKGTATAPRRIGGKASETVRLLLSVLRRSNHYRDGGTDTGLGRE